MPCIWAKEVVGPSVGMSGSTYSRAKTIVKAAEDPEQPADIREAADRYVRAALRQRKKQAPPER